MNFPLNNHPFLRYILIAFPFLLLANVSCRSDSEEIYLDSFDDAGRWGVGVSPDVEGQVVDGAYEMLVKDVRGIYLATGGLSYRDGTIEVSATQLEGPLNSGYGLVFRVDDNSDSFYAFEVSGDGFVWIGRCRSLCEEEEQPLFGRGWYRSEAVKTGYQATNLLQVIAEGSSMRFLVNGIQVGRTVDTSLIEGDVGLTVETLGQPGVKVQFDDFALAPS